MSYIGTTGIGKMYLGGTAIGKAYLGEDLVYDSAGGSVTPVLPYDAEIEYLQTSGTQYINTGIIQQSRNFEVSIRFQWVGSTASQFESFFAYMAAGSSITPRSGFHKYVGSWMFGTNTTTSASARVDGNVHDILWTSNASTQKEQLFLDGTKIGEGTTASTGLSTNTIPFFIGCRNRNGSTDNPTSMRIMSLNYKYFSDSAHTTLVQEWDFVPVRVGSTGYMYDKISGQLFGNNGTGSFTLGNDITYTALDYIKFTGSQWILTDYHPNPKTHLVIDMQFEANGNAGVGNGGNQWIGCYNNTIGVFRANFGGNAGQYGEIFYWLEKPYVSTVWNGNYGNNVYNRSTFTYLNNKVTFQGTGTNTETKTTTQDGYLTIGINESLTTIFNRHNLKIFSMKIYEDNVLLHEYFPKTDGTNNGLYDTVTDTFITSQTATNLVGA